MTKTLLHALWSDARLHLWAESAQTLHPLPNPPSSAPQYPPSSTIPPNPIALTTQDLHIILGELSSDSLLSTIADESSLILWLPTSNSTPIGSLAADSPAPIDPSLASFKTPTLAFLPADAIDILNNLAATNFKDCGDSIRFWAQFAQTVRSLLARQQFLPDLAESTPASYRARWRLLVQDESELGYLEELTAAMPPICRAVASDHPDAADPVRLVDDFLSTTAESLIRRALADDPFFKQIQHKADAAAPPELHWISALLHENSAPLSSAVKDPADFAALIAAWTADLQAPDNHPHPTLALTLREPDPLDPPASARWTVEIELRDHNARRISIESILLERDEVPSLLGRRRTSRRQHLLAELRRAAQSFPALRRLLDLGPSSSLELNTAEAHAFLRQHAPFLRSQGIAVRLPDWTDQTQHRLGLELHVRPLDDSASHGELSLGRIGLNALLGFDWRVAVGDDQISARQFESMLAQGDALVRLNDRWIEIDPDAAQKAIRFIRRRGPRTATLLDAIRTAAGQEDDETGLPVLGIRGADWLDRFFDASPSLAVKTLEQPAAFHGEMRPYQCRGLSWMAFLDSIGIGACLADDMGLGKTIQLIALLLHERAAATAPVGPTLLFTPMSVVGNWQRELTRFAPSLRTLVHRGADRFAGDAFLREAQNHDVVVTTYGLAPRDQKDLARVPWRRIALDEAQKIKNPSAHQTIAIRALAAESRIALTGTPLENHLSELWSIIEMLNPGLLGTAADFRRRFAVPIEKLGDQPRADQLRKMLRPFILRRLKNDPTVECDLPEKMEMRVYCNLTAEQAAHYERTVAEMLAAIDAAVGIRRRGLILATLTRLKQVCNHPSHLLHDNGPLDNRSGKCERLVEMLEEVLEEGDAALVFTQYRVMGDLLQKLLNDRLRSDILFMHGAHTAQQRDKMILGFQESPDAPRIFILSLKTGGFGLNLTRANHVFHFDRWWNPAVEDQATNRAHRIGQTRRVQVHKFVCIGTIEDRIDQLLTEKSALADKIVGSGDQWLTGLSTKELREYLVLSPEAVAEN